MLRKILYGILPPRKTTTDKHIISFPGKSNKALAISSNTTVAKQNISGLAKCQPGIAIQPRSTHRPYLSVIGRHRNIEIILGSRLVRVDLSEFAAGPKACDWCFRYHRVGVLTNVTRLHIHTRCFIPFFSVSLIIKRFCIADCNAVLMCTYLSS